LIFKVVALISTFMLVRDPGDCLQYGFSPCRLPLQFIPIWIMLCLDS